MAIRIIAAPRIRSMDAMRDFKAAPAVTAGEGIVPGIDYDTLSLKLMSRNSIRAHPGTALGLRIQRSFNELTGSSTSDELIRFYNHLSAR